MDPSDIGKNDDNTGFTSNRRISSILKAPRKSVRFQDSELRENEVPCAKPEKHEKRNSRRVSFAPANDVLLFSKDVKNGSPIRTPFQELMSMVEPMQKSVQVLQVEDVNQEILGMPFYLIIINQNVLSCCVHISFVFQINIGIPQINTPLHATELNGKVNFENGQDFGEKTVVFSEDDVFMDMTQSHTINITHNGLLDASQSHPNTLNSCGNKTSAKRETILMGLSHNMSTGGITDFKVTSSVSASKASSNNLLSLSKSSGSNVTLLETSHSQIPQIKSQRVDLNKENQAPSFQVYLEKEKSGHNGMDITTTHAELEDDDDDDDDPFRCLIPSQKMYSQSDIVSQSRHAPKTPHKQTSMMEGLSNQKAVFGVRFDKENAEDYLQITDPISFKKQSSAASQQQICNSKQKCTEKTWSTADDDCMDMTQSYPVKIMNEQLSSSPTPNLGISLSEGKNDILASSMEKKNKESKELTKETAQTVSPDIVLEPKFKHFLATLFKPECQRVTSGDAGMTQMKEANEQPFIGHSSHPKEDQKKLMTTFPKVSILENTGSNEPIQYPLPMKKIQLEVGQTIFQQVPSARQRSSYISGKEMTLKVNDQINSATQEDCRGQSGMQPVVLEYDGVNSTTLPTKSNQTMDSSSSTHTNSTHSDGSTFKHSMSDSRFDDSDVQKLENGTLTVLQFFQLFSIDFVIHKPRQSISHGKLPYTGCSPMDQLKNRHINHPQKMVYEGNLEILSGNVEGLYARMMHLNKPLNVINKSLWNEMKKSSEKEISTFGAKLKERNNFFRKMSKVRSHEMKEALYSNLAQAITDEQEKLKSKVALSDEMIKILDGCIYDLEADLATIEDKGTQNMASLKSLEEEIKNANDTLGDKKRQMYEMDLQTRQASRKLDILKNETKNLQGFVKMLNIVTEWRFGEKMDNHTIYTFLYDTLHLQVVHKGDSAEKEAEKKTSNINFKFLLDEEKSQDHTRLVHKLLSQYIEGETAWVEKYPTYRHIPKLLHDVSLVVSHCRLLGEEIRLMRMWGGLRLNIVDISCVDTRVNITFSSVKRLSRFEVTLSVSLVNHFYVVQLQAFNNFFGDATACQIKQIVESFSPGKKHLTKIVKKINCDLLS
ncbi:uncharacterized protein knl1 [Stigmatopora nigra]